jgi:hypothetical protein
MHKSKPAVLLCLFLLFAIPALANDTAAIRAEVVQILTQLVTPATQAPEEGKAWHLHLEGKAMGKEGNIHVAWDGDGRHGIRTEISGFPGITATFGHTESWLYLHEKDKAFFATHAKPEADSLLEDCSIWPVLKAQIPVLLGLAQFAPLPEDLELSKADDGTIGLKDGKELDIAVKKHDSGEIEIVSNSEKNPGQLVFKTWSQVPIENLLPIFKEPDTRNREEVDIRHLRSMLVTMIDFGSENVLVRANPRSLPRPLADVPQDQGIAVVKFSGTPEEMGKQHGEMLKDAVHYNMHRTLHGVGFMHTVETGEWFPTQLAKVWKDQEQYIPERFIREIDAVADTAGIPREWGRSVNVFPELFHCSGLALCGKATVGGALYHGRVLDYMTQIGLQNTAAIMVFEPSDGNAWMSVGYAGMCSTVTAMNEKGLAMGEMGGGGVGYVDGIPMSLMMREIMERFETTEEALNWMKETPRTCEYFYVLSDAKTKNMAGIASYSAKLAKERGTDNLQIIRPGTVHELLPHPFEDAVLMSADRRYKELVNRVEKGYSKIDMQGAWDLMDGGVAMKSNLHTALFAPETLDFWTAQAGPLGEPAYSQKIAKFNLRALLDGEVGVQTSDAGSPGAK